MRSGALRHSITIEQVTETPDGAGGLTKTWATFTQSRASYEPLMGKELFTAQQEQANVSTRFRTRYCAGITTKMRLVMDGRTFNIESVIDPWGRHRELHLMCVEDV